MRKASEEEYFLYGSKLVCYIENNIMSYSIIGIADNSPI